MTSFVRPTPLTDKLYEYVLSVGLREPAVFRELREETGTLPDAEWQIAPEQGPLLALLATLEVGTFDYAFIDADKSNYDGYYERCLQLVRPGGLIAIDNTLWDGKVADDAVTDADTAAIRALNKKLHMDDRIGLCFLPFADGLTLCQRR